MGFRLNQTEMIACPKCDQTTPHILKKYTVWRDYAFICTKCDNKTMIIKHEDMDI